MLLVSTSPAAPEPAAPLVPAGESTSDPPPVPAGSADAAPASSSVSVTVPQPAGVGSVPMVLLVGPGQVVAQPPAPPTAVFETGSTPQNAPSADSSLVSGVDSAQEKVGCLEATIVLKMSNRM